MTTRSVAFLVLKGKSTLESGGYTVDDGTATRVDEPPAAPDVTFSVMAPDADAVNSGELDIAVGFMRGQIKMAGDNGALLDVLPALSARRRRPEQ